MSILGLNLRNAIIARNNSRPTIRLVNDKYATKVALAEHHVPVPGTISLIRSRYELGEFDWNCLPESWALKPNRGRRGEGIMLADAWDGNGWRTASGSPLRRDAIRFQVERILDGEHSLEGLERDVAMFEPLIRPNHLLGAIVPEGLPDVRVICFGQEPLMAMTRLPTTASGGKANLHQGAIGAAIDMETGAVFRAMLGEDEVTHHPDTGFRLLGLQIPHWGEIVAAATRCGPALGLGYCGADIVLDRERGPLVIECNAYPGLQIQAINATGLKARLDAVARQDSSFWSRFQRSAHYHADFLSRERRLRQLGPAPLHPGFESIEDLLRMDGTPGFSMFSAFTKFFFDLGVDPALADEAEKAMRAGAWEERGVGPGDTMIVRTTAWSNLVVTGRIERQDTGEPCFRMTKVSAVHSAARRKGRFVATGPILIIDDEPLIADYLADELVHAGHTAHCAHDGESARQRLAQEIPAAILLDHSLPDTDGVTLLRAIRKDPRLTDVPVLMITGNNGFDLIHEAFAAGADEYLVKPFDAVEVVARLERLASAAKS